VDQVLEFEKELHRYFHDEYPEVLEALKEKRRIDDDLEADLRRVIAELKEHFVRSHQEKEKTEQGEEALAAEGA
jgi:F0F1-type ATP synthase alpha subunit